MKANKMKNLKLIFILVISIIAIWLFGMKNEVRATIISGKIVDENDNPIGGITVEYGSGGASASTGRGNYSVDGSGSVVKYNFTNGEQYEEASATTLRYEPQDTSRKYNIVIVRPEGDNYKSEAQQLEQMLSNANLKNGKEIITYNNTDFEYRGTRITSPYRKYTEDLYDNRCINLFIVIATNDMPSLGDIPKGSGELWKRNIFYKVSSSVEEPKNMQITTEFDIIKNYVKDYGKVEATTEVEIDSANINLQSSYVEITGIDDSKSREINLKLKRVINNVTPTYSGNYIEGKVVEQVDAEGGPEEKPIEGALVELYEADGVTQVVNSAGDIITARTDEHGQYVLEDVPGAEIIPIINPPPEPSWYEIKEKQFVVKFTYGDLEQFKLAKTLKYNGLDYESLESDSESNEQQRWRYNIMDTGNQKYTSNISVSEVDVCLVIDTSESMANGGKLDRLKSGLSDLISDINGIGGSTCIVTVNQDGPAIKQNVDEIELKGQAQMDKGIDCGIEVLDFMKDTRPNARQVMIVITDSWSDEGSMIYSYVQAGGEVEGQASRGIDVLTIFSDYNELQHNCSTIGTTPQAQVKSGSWIATNEGNGAYDLEQALSEDAIKYVQGEMIGTQVNVHRISNIRPAPSQYQFTVLAQDCADRREEVINFISNGIGYEEGEKLNKIDKVNLDETAYDTNEEAADGDYTWVGENTHMTAMGTIIIDSIPINGDPVGYTRNLKLKERPKLEVELKKEVSTIKVTLADGNTLIYKDIENEENNIGDIISNPGVQHLAVMDDELLHGATLEIKYKIEVECQGSPFNTKYTVYDYIDNEVMLKKEEALAIGWVEISDDEREKLVRSMVNTYGIDENEIRATLSDKTIIRKDFDIDNPEAELTVTRLLTTNSTDEYENFIEIAKYYNDVGRRIYFTTPANINLQKIYNGEEIDVFEPDEANAELVNIIPPFGGENVSTNTKAHIYEKIYIVRNRVENFRKSFN